jgi:membrane protein DedA with SNARE-associated domain
VHYVATLIGTIPPYAVYGLVFLIIGVESMGIPLPGEVALVSSALLAATGAVSPWGVAIAASAGAIVGDSCGYVLGRRGGPALFARLSRRFPRHLGPAQIARAERAFHRWGVWAVFFGRFVALLRILAGPIAGSLRMPYWRFLLANMGGGILWAGGTTMVIFYLGRVAERWLAGLSWGMLGLIVFATIATVIVLRRPRRRRDWAYAESRCAVSGENAGRQIATYSAPSGPGDE